MTFPVGEDITLITRTRTGTDSDGNDVFTNTATVVANCGFDPGGSTEILNGRDTVTSVPTIYIPAGTAVGAVDAATVRGVTYEVSGVARDWRSPLTGWQPGIVVTLKAVTG